MSAGPDPTKILRLRAREVLDGSVPLFAWRPESGARLAIHPALYEEIRSGETAPWGLELDLLSGILAQGLTLRNTWPGTTIHRYDLLIVGLSIGVVALEEGGHCVLGAFEKPGGD